MERPSFDQLSASLPMPAMVPMLVIAASGATMEPMLRAAPPATWPMLFRSLPILSNPSSAPRLLNEAPTSENGRVRRPIASLTLRTVAVALSTALILIVKLLSTLLTPPFVWLGHSTMPVPSSSGTTHHAGPNGKTSLPGQSALASLRRGTRFGKTLEEFVRSYQVTFAKFLHGA